MGKWYNKKVAKKGNKQFKRGRGKGQKNYLLPRSVKQKIWGVLMGLIAIIITLSFFELAGAGGRLLKIAFDLLIGKAIFSLPLIMLLASIMFFSPKYKNKWPVFFATLLLTLGISGFLSSLATRYLVLDQNIGGLLGYAALWPLFRIFGFWVSIVVFFGMIIVGLLIVFQFLHLDRASKKKVEPGITFEQGSIDQEFPSDEQRSLAFSKKKSSSLIKKIFRPKFKISKVEAEQETDELAIIPITKIKDKIGIRNRKATATIEGNYQLPPLDLLDEEKGFPGTGDTRIHSAIIKKTLENFEIPVEMSGINIGPTVTQYTLKPTEGVKLSKITALSNDLALALAAHPLRIEAPIPGKSLVGIEIPNSRRVTVRLRNVLENPGFRATGRLPLALGRDVAGLPVYADLAGMPHLLIAGATGTGKTIGLSIIILSLLYHQSPETLRFVLVDPKRVEFSIYKELPHLLCPVIFSAQKVINALKWLIEEMERRFDLLSEAKTRDIASFNNSNASKENKLPYIVVVIDELADLMASRGKEIEAGIVRLAQMARAVGIHLVVATQRPSVEVITGLIKANITSRISCRVASQVDSRTVLDASGAEKLLGRGDMLFLSPETKKPRRIQGAYISEKEVKKVVSFIINNYGRAEEEIAEEKVGSATLEQALDGAVIAGASAGGVYGNDDPLYEDAQGVVLAAKKASASLLQRRLRIGYARAARLIDMLENGGVVGPADGSKPREVYVEGAETSEEAIDEETLESGLPEEEIKEE